MIDPSRRSTARGSCTRQCPSPRAALSPTLASRPRLPPESSANFARPKSSTLTCAAGVIITLAGLTSRWMIPIAVRGLQCFGDLTADGDDLARRQRPSAQMLGQGSTLDMFHRDEVVTVALADVVDDRDIGMGERRGRPRLLHESLQSIGVELPVAGAVSARRADSDVCRARETPHPCRRHRAATRPDTGRRWYPV